MALPHEDERAFARIVADLRADPRFAPRLDRRRRMVLAVRVRLARSRSHRAVLLAVPVVLGLICWAAGARTLAVGVLAAPAALLAGAGARRLCCAVRTRIRPWWRRRRRR